VWVFGGVGGGGGGGGGPSAGTAGDSVLVWGQGGLQDKSFGTSVYSHEFSKATSLRVD